MSKPRRKKKLKIVKSFTSVKAIKRDVQALKKMVNKTIENKQQNLTHEGLVVRDFPVVSRPTLELTQGSADGDARPSAARIGNSVTLMRTQLNMSVKISTGVTNCRCRVMVVESVNGNEDLTMDDILQAGGGALDGTEDKTYTSCYTTKTGTNKRYKIHFDRIINLSTYDRAFYLKKLILRYGKSGKVINYDGNASTPTDYNLQVLAISDQSLLAACPVLTYSLRSTYKDA